MEKYILQPSKNSGAKYKTGSYNNSLDNCDWKRGENTVVTNSHPLNVPKTELYLSDSIPTNNNQIKIEFFPKFRVGSKIERYSHLKSLSSPYRRKEIPKVRNQTTLKEYFSNTKNNNQTVLNEDKSNSFKNIHLKSKPSREQNYNIVSPGNTTSKENKPDSIFDIDIALQLSASTSCVNSNKNRSKRKISEYFPSKKYDYKNPSSIKTSNWISLNLFQSKYVNEELNENSNCILNVPSTTEKFHPCSNQNSILENTNVKSLKSSHMLETISKSDWFSRRLKTDPTNKELTVPSEELFVTPKLSNKWNIKSCSAFEAIGCEKLYTGKIKKKLWRKKTSQNKQKRNQSNLYDHYMKYFDESVFVTRISADEKLQYNYNEEHFKNFFGEETRIMKNTIHGTQNDLVSQNFFLPSSEKKKDNIQENLNHDLKLENGERKDYNEDIAQNEFILSTKVDEEFESNHPCNPCNNITKNIRNQSSCDEKKIDSSLEAHFILPEFSQSEVFYNEFPKHYSIFSSQHDESKKGIVKNEFDTTSIQHSHGSLLYSENAYPTNMNSEEYVAETIDPKENIIIQKVNTCNPIGNKKIQNLEFESQKSLTEACCDILESVSSPIITDLECRTYLKDFLNIPEKLQNSQKSNTNWNAMSCEEIFGINHNNSQEKHFLKFWENISSQNQEDSSQRISDNIAKSLPENVSQRVHIAEGKMPRNGSDVFQYILSQEFACSDLLINNALKNMDNLSQKIMEKRSSIFDSNQNSNKLLEMALKMYAQCKERSILSVTGASNISPSIKLKVMKKCEGNTCIYKIIRKGAVAHREDDSYRFILWEDDTSMKSITKSDEKILMGLKDMCKNKAFLYVEMEDGPYSLAKTTDDIASKIKNIFEYVLKDLEDQKSPYLEIPRQTYEDCMFVDNRLELKREKNHKMIMVKYRSSSSQSKFCLMMFVLAKILQMLETNSKTTRRELYYQIKHLISNQSYIDRAVKAVSYMLCVGPWDLNIVAHKGMVFGNVKIVMSSNDVINCNLPGTLIPQDVDEIVEISSPAVFILVVEKESIFYKLLEEDLPNKLVRPFIMITGKGFPDLNTQLFLRKLWMIMTIPVFILTDADPHGVYIMMCYRFGALANAHLSRHLAIPKAQWLGIFPSEIVKFNAEKQPLTESEKNYLQNMLKSPYMKINAKIEKELKFMLECGYKAGIEGIIKNNTFLSEFYFPLKFHNKDLI